MLAHPRSGTKKATKLAVTVPAAAAANTMNAGRLIIIEHYCTTPSATNTAHLEKKKPTFTLKKKNPCSLNNIRTTIRARAAARPSLLVLLLDAYY